MTPAAAVTTTASTTSSTASTVGRDLGRHLARLGEAIAAGGLGRYEAEVASVAARARRARVADAAAGVLVDRGAPAIARERAFAVVCRALASAMPLEPTGPVARSAA